MLLNHRHVLKHAVRLILAWLFLNLLINVDYPLSSTQFFDLLRPSLEVWSLLLILSILAVFNVSSAWLSVPLVLVFVFLRLFRFGDVLAPDYFSRPFNLYIDSGYVPDLIHLLFHSFSMHRLVLYVPAAAALLAALLWGIYKSFQIALAAFSTRPLRRTFWGLTIVLIALVSLYPHGADPLHTGFPATTCAPRLVQEAAFILRIGDIKSQGLAAVQMAGSRIPSFPAPLDRLKKSDVHLIFIESYGETLFAEIRYTQEFVPMVQAFETALRQSGFAMCSGLLESPTFGGSSWLGFGTLESGVWLSDQLRYNFLINSKVKPLADYFNQAGYRTVSVMPGTTMPWPEGKYFQYTQTYYAKDLDYQGPRFSWSTMPDQFVLNVIYNRELAHRSQPLFIRYMLTSTHAPFNVQPQYLENWDEIGHGEIYNRLPPINFSVNWPDMTEAGVAYATAMRYDFTVLQDYLTRLVKDEALIIILGDHQPITHVSGQAASKRVPMHVISRNPALLDSFIRMGYTPGMIPGHALSAKGMNDFLADFVIAFSTPRAVDHP